jgi:hypothetical protein
MTQPVPTLSPQQMAAWDLTAFTVTLGGFAISRGRGASGYGPDVVFTFKQSKPDFTEQEGADGFVTVSATNSVLAEIEMTFMQSNSASNAFLSTARIAAKAAGVPLVMPFLAVDQNGTTRISALKCWISAPPDMEFKSDAGPRTWKLKGMFEILFQGGN